MKIVCLVISYGEGCGDACVSTGLTRLNEAYDEDEDSIPKERTRKKFPAIYKKCSAHKFWLFAEVGRLVVEDLQRLVETFRPHTPLQ